MTASPQGFKGIALFTPGGDLIYCIDPGKQSRWHIHLCGALQHLLNLPEPPHFLAPALAATLDRTVHPLTQQIIDFAELSPLVKRYQPLLNTVFGTTGLTWQLASLPSDTYDPMVLATYRSQFPQLWDCHDLVVRYDQTFAPTQLASAVSSNLIMSNSETQGYVLRLFVSGHSMATQRILQKLHGLLEQALTQPYTLKVLDVSQHPEQAEIDQVRATPTLVRAYPLPVRRIVGILDNVDQLLGVLKWPD